MAAAASGAYGQQASWTLFGPPGGGDDVAWIGLGGEIRPADKLALRAAYETPITNGADPIDWRITLSAVYSF